MTKQKNPFPTNLRDAYICTEEKEKFVHSIYDACTMAGSPESLPFRAQVWYDASALFTDYRFFQIRASMIEH